MGICRGSLSLLFCSLFAHAIANVGYIPAQDGFIYTFESTAPAFVPVTPFTADIPGIFPSSLALHESLLYSGFATDNTIYTFDPSALPGATPMPFTTAFGNSSIACRVAFHNSIGYAVPADNTGLVYSFNPAAAPGMTPSACTTAIASTNLLFIGFHESLAYVGGDTGVVYTFDPTQVSPLPMPVTMPLPTSAAATFIAFRENIGYISGSTGIIFTFNPADITPVPMALTVALASSANAITFDDSLAYITGSDGIIYTFHPNEPTPISVAQLTMSIGNTAFQLLFPFSSATSSSISTEGLKGNNLRLANYLNENAPQEILGLFTSSSNLPRALKSAAPTRNAASTWMAEMAQLAWIQVFNHHQRRNHPLGEITSSLLSHQNPDHLLTWRNPNFPKKEPPFCKRFSPWLGVFGDYTRQNAQSQMPFFHAGSGGAVALLDYDGSLSLQAVGIGAAYAYTRLNQSRGAGHATINQGALTAYGTWAGLNGYCDFAAWGGFYENHNVRHVTVSLVSGNASSHTHGWQLTPHLEVGYARFLRNTTTVSMNPFVSADWVHCWEAAFREQGLEGLNMGQPKRTCSLLRLEGGFRLQETANVCWGSLFFREKASYVYQQSFHTNAISAFLVGSPGSFTFSIFTKRQQLGVLEFEVFFEPYSHQYPYGSLAYQGQFGSSYQSQQGMLTIGMDF